MGGYFPEKPSRTDDFPNSYREAQTVLRKMKRPDFEYFELTDASPRHAFTKYMDEKGLDYDPEFLKQIIEDTQDIMRGYKDYYNRPRPAQVNTDITSHESYRASETAKTPAYPSGHAFQAYVLAQKLSRKYPLHYFKFFRIADRIANARVSVGLHYPSDNTKAHKLAMQL